MDLNFEVTNQIIKRLDQNVLVNKSQNYVKCNFEFKTPEWETLEKFVIFKDSWGNAYTCHLGVSCTNECIVPDAALKGTNFKVSVYGGELITSNELTVLLIPSGYTTNISSAEEGGKDVFVEVFEKLESKIDNIAYEEHKLCCYSDGVLLLEVPLQVTWNDLVDVPESFPPTEHTHITQDVTDFEDTVDLDLDNLLTNLTDHIRMI